MPDTETTPLEQGVAAETAPQETQTAPKDSETQVPASPQVEGGEQQPQAQPAPRPSDFVRSRRDMRDIKQQISSQAETIKEMAALIKSQSKSPEAEKFDKEVFFNDPETTFRRLKEDQKAEIAELRKEIGSFRENQTQSDRQRNAQEALEMLFPNNPGSDESLEDRIESNPERAEKVMTILKSTGLDDFSQNNPKQAAKLALKLLEEKPNPTAIPKKLMGGTARGGMGAKNPNPKEDKRSELKRLMDESAQNEELRFDEKHKSRRSQLIRELEKLETEKE